MSTYDTEEGFRILLKTRLELEGGGKYRVQIRSPGRPPVCMPESYDRFEDAQAMVDALKKMTASSDEDPNKIEKVFSDDTDIRVSRDQGDAGLG